MMNEHGVSVSRNTGMQTKQVQVIKCKSCGEILSQEHNFHYTAEELARMNAEVSRSARFWVFFVPATPALLLVGYSLIGLSGGLFGEGKKALVDVAPTLGIGFVLGIVAWFFRPWQKW